MLSHKINSLVALNDSSNQGAVFKSWLFIGSRHALYDICRECHRRLSDIGLLPSSVDFTFK